MSRAPAMIGDIPTVDFLILKNRYREVEMWLSRNILSWSSEGVAADRLTVGAR